ncbi:MAG: low temperature requirement protein A, partial [Vicinamibacterales bacterium]
FGLFTIILLGESMIAVMQGMERQETWSLPAAAAAFGGMAVAFFFWWWYFDGPGAAGAHPLRARRHLWRFHVWAYGHSPLYLGIAVTGVGFEHVITAGGVMLHHGELALLSGAVALTAAVLSGLGLAGGRGAVPA